MMKPINNYITEKLYIDKKFKIDINKKDLMDEIKDATYKIFVKKLISGYSIEYYDENKIGIKKPEDAWFADIKFYCTDNKVNGILNELKKRLSGTLMNIDDSIQFKDGFGTKKDEHVVRIFLYDPED